MGAGGGTLAGGGSAETPSRRRDAAGVAPGLALALLSAAALICEGDPRSFPAALGVAVAGGAGLSGAQVLLAAAPGGWVVHGLPGRLRPGRRPRLPPPSAAAVPAAGGAILAAGLLAGTAPPELPALLLMPVVLGAPAAVLAARAALRVPGREGADGG